MPIDHLTNPSSKLRWFYPTPAHLFIILLIIEGILLLSERFKWFAFSEKKGWTVLIAIASVGVTMVVMLLWFVLALLFRNRFQFSLRLLFVLTAAVAIPFSWLAVEMKWAREQKEAAEALIKLGGQVQYDYRFRYESESLVMPTTNTTLDVPAWLRQVLGDDFFCDVTYIELAYKQVTNADLQHLTALKQLQHLNLWHSTITDTGLEHLEGMNQLQWLGLAGAEITDGGLKRLEVLKQLRWLWLQKNAITDGGLEHLEKLKELKELDLTDTKVTNAGVTRLKKALPKLISLSVGQNR